MHRLAYIRNCSRNQEVGSMGVGAGVYVYDVVAKEFTFAISSPDEFLFSIISIVCVFYGNEKGSGMPVY